MNMEYVVSVCMDGGCSGSGRVSFSLGSGKSGVVHFGLVQKDGEYNVSGSIYGVHCTTNIYLSLYQNIEHGYVLSYS